MSRIHYLFAILAFAALGLQCRAEEKPLAVCKDGKCEMSEKDYKALQEYVARVKEMAEHNNKVELEVNSTLEAYMGALAKCKAEKSERKTKWGF